MDVHVVLSTEKQMTQTCHFIILLFAMLFDIQYVHNVNAASLSLCLCLPLTAFSSKYLVKCPKCVFLLFLVNKMSSGGALITDTLASHGSEKPGCEGWRERHRDGGREGEESHHGMDETFLQVFSAQTTTDCQLKFILTTVAAHTPLNRLCRVSHQQHHKLSITRYSCSTVTHLHSLHCKECNTVLNLGLFHIFPYQIQKSDNCIRLLNVFFFQFISSFSFSRGVYSYVDAQQLM